MDIGEQKRVIQVEPEPVRTPAEEPAPELPAEPVPVPERREETVPSR